MHHYVLYLLRYVKLFLPQVGLVINMSLSNYSDMVSLPDTTDKFKCSPSNHCHINISPFFKKVKQITREVRGDIQLRRFL